MVPKDYGEILLLINEFISRDVATSVGPLNVLHRRLETQDVYYVFNPAPTPLTAEVSFRATGAVEKWDAWTTEVSRLSQAVGPEGFSTLRLTFAAREAKVIVFRRQDWSNHVLRSSTFSAVELQQFDGPWNFTVRPTLDNRFGDFRLPATNGLLAPEVSRFKWAEENTAGVNWHERDFDDSSWPETTYSFGPRFEVMGPLPPNSRSEGPWRPYSFSLRWGIERDPFLTDWFSGPHGLKNKVPDEFLDFNCDQPGSEWHLRASVVVDADREATMILGGRCAYRVWINGELVMEQAEPLPPGRHAPWNIPHYECEPREATVRLHKGVNHLRLKLVQPEGQRTRAFVAFNPPPPSSNCLGLRWFTQQREPRPALLASPERRATWLRCLAPPGLKGLQFVSRGRARVWAHGHEMAIEKIETLSDGSLRYRAVTKEMHAEPVLLAWRIESDPEYRAGDVFLEPVRFECGTGKLPMGDWCAHGLAVYSGIGEYERSFELTEWPRDGRIVLDLGDISASAEVRVNGISAGVLIAPPWRVDVTDLVQVGKNTLTIQIANTLANHYSVGIPTPYAFPHQTRSGLFGPVRLMYEQNR
jgi:hypothetical protein